MEVTGDAISGEGSHTFEKLLSVAQTLSWCLSVALTLS